MPMNSHIFLRRFGLLLVAAVIAACSAPDEEADSGAPIELIYNTYLPPVDAVRQVSVDDFARRIEEESGGAIEVTIPGASLSDSSNQLSLVTEGVADLAIVPVFTNRARWKLPSIADLPLNCISAEAASVALWNTQQNYFAEVNEFSEVELLALYVLPPLQLIGNVRPVMSIDDFDGLKIWAAAGTQTETVQRLGAIPVFTLYNELFEYTSKGNVDALLLGPGTAKQAGIGDYIQYMTEFDGGLGSMSFAVVMNRASFENLDDDEKSAVLRAAEGLPGRVGRRLDERNREGMEEVQLAVNTADADLMEELRQRLQPQFDGWLESAEQAGLAGAGEALAYFREEMARIAANGE